MYVKEVETLLGIDRDTIRFYISKGLIQPERDESRYRIYTDETVQTLKRILVLRDLGFGIQQIKALINGAKALDSKELKARIDALSREREDARRAIDICSDMIVHGDKMDFDPDPYFRRRIDR